MPIRNNQEGQMLLEALIALSVVVMVLVGLLSATVVSIRNSSFSQNVVLANQYAQEALEKVRQARDKAVDWNTFVTNYNQVKCIDSGPPCTSCPNSSGTPNIGIFYRCLSIDNSFADKAIVTAYVSWQENGQTHQSQLDTILSKWSK